MDGDIAPLPEIVALAKKYNAITFMDEAHATGVFGKNGRGT
jgi:7-keto-8-aminopelargonate synthetase-like enzyme